MSKFSAYMRGEGIKGDTGPAANFGQFFATAHNSNSPEVSVTTSGENTEKNVYFDFGLQPGIAGGFSTNQYGTITRISTSAEPYVTITTDINSPNSEKVFNFDFGIPNLKEIQNINQEIISTTSGGDNILRITLTDGSTTTFTIRNGYQGQPSIIEGSVSSTSQLPIQDNYLGRGFLVGETTKSIYLYLEENDIKQWVNQGVINYANFGTPIVESYSIPSTSNPIVEVTPIENSPNTEKIFKFEFGIPKGETPIIGITTSITTLSPNELPIASITTLENNNFKINFGIPYPEIKTSASTTTLYPFQEAQVTTSFSNNNVHFDFKIPKGEKGDTGPSGEEGYGFYRTITFTDGEEEEETENYTWIEELDNSYTLIIDRTEEEIIPINIYNSNNNNIAATFTLGTSTNDYPYGTIQYNTKEKFNGILYYIGKAPTPQLRIGDIITAETTEANITIRKDNYDSYLDFIIPSSGPRGYKGEGITSISLSTIEDNIKTYDIIYGENSDITSFTLKDGEDSTIEFNQNIIIDSNTTVISVSNNGDNKHAFLTFTFPQSLQYIASTTDIREDMILPNGIFYFVYEDIIE